MNKFEKRKNENITKKPQQSHSKAPETLVAGNVVYGSSFSPAAIIDRRVDIFSDLSATTQEGEPVLLWSELVGFDNLCLSLQWQYNAGTGWQNISEGGDGLTYTFMATKTLLECSWRLSVSICT